MSNGQNPYGGAGGYTTTVQYGGDAAPKPAADGSSLAPRQAPADLIKDTTTAGFAADVIRESRQQPVLVDFWAPWCGPCRQMAPGFEQAAARLEPNVRLVKVDTEAVPSLGARFGIRSIPTLALFKGGREVARQAGAMGPADIVRWTEAHAR